MCSDVQRFSADQKMFICCFLKTKSTSQCRREFRQNVPDFYVLICSEVHKVVKKFKTTEPVLKKEITQRCNIFTDEKLGDISA
jgi:hypothetical protein